jgi:surfactin synthase thioesterase subunit
VLRADIRAVEAAHGRTDLAPIPVPILAVGGAEDRIVLREELEGWAALTSSGLALETFGGDHFYLNTPPTRAKLLATIEAHRARVTGPGVA